MYFFINVFVGFILLSATIIPSSLEANFYYMKEQDLEMGIKAIIPQGEGDYKYVAIVLDGDIVLPIYGENYKIVMNFGWSAGDRAYVKFIRTNRVGQYSYYYTYEITNLNINSTVSYIYLYQVDWE